VFRRHTFQKAYSYVVSKFFHLKLLDRFVYSHGGCVGSWKLQLACLTLPDLTTTVLLREHCGRQSLILCFVRVRHQLPLGADLFSFSSLSFSFRGPIGLLLFFVNR
jgi:hypothetical protein